MILYDDTMKDSQLIDLFQRSRHSKKTVVIEGVQALKHAVRFQAEIEVVVTSDTVSLKKYLTDLAPDVSNKIVAVAQEVSEATFLKLSPQPPRTKVIAVAQRFIYALSDCSNQKPLVFLEEPKDLENIGAVIRVAAAADAAGVAVSGNIDIWHPAIIRGAAGLHFAIPVFNLDFKLLCNDYGGQSVRPVISLDPAGKLITEYSMPINPILVFGTERYGISKETLESSNAIVALPMKKGVSSLNLATSVAATLYML